MTIKGWSAAALMGCWLIAGCYGMKPEMKEGQSHWLTACAEQADCNEGELCACGVCTIACEGEAACGAEGSCADIDDRTACDEATASVASVCLEDCEHDDDCDSAALVCSSGACVAVASDEPPDASEPDGPDEPPSAPDDAGIIIDDEPLATGRQPCSPTWTCEDGLVCHNDSTCIERGGADENGIATIARAVVPDIEHAYELGIGGYVVTEDAVYWEDIGNTQGATEVHLDNGAVYRFDLQTEEVTTSADGLTRRIGELFVDDERTYSAQESSIDYFALDGMTSGAIAMEVLENRVTAAWFAQNGSVFYAPFRSTRIERVTPATATEPTGTPMLQLDAGFQILGIAGDGQRVFIETHTIPTPGPMPAPAEPNTRLWVVDEDGQNLEMITDDFRGTDVERKFIAHDGWVYAVKEEHFELIAVEVATGQKVTLASHPGPRMYLWSVSDSFAYYTTDLFDIPDLSLTYRREIWRVARGGGEPELLRRTIEDVVRVQEAGGYLYWIESTGLLRKAL